MSLRYHKGRMYVDKSHIEEKVLLWILEEIEAMSHDITKSNFGFKEWQ